MPYRKLIFTSGEIYHIFNRSIAGQPIFKGLKDYERIIDVINFYRFEKQPLRYSHFRRLADPLRDQYIKLHFSKDPMLEILAFCIMPNHFHFLIKPKSNRSISDFMRNIQNSYSKYYNTKYQRTGSLFQFMFKAVRVETDEQLLHVSRYIHLNPVTAYLIDIEGLQKYLWSSFSDYSDSVARPFIDASTILAFFKSSKKYREFVFNQVEYQRELDKIKHLTLE